MCNYLKYSFTTQSLLGGEVCDIKKISLIIMFSWNSAYHKKRKHNLCKANYTHILFFHTKYLYATLVFNKLTLLTL